MSRKFKQNFTCQILLKGEILEPIGNGERIKHP